MKRSLAFAVIAMFAGCKSGVGARCQVQDDCQSGLVCNETKGVCEEVGQGNPIDASVPDVAIDAPTDAATDAAVD